MLDSLLGTNLVLASTQLSFGTFFMRAFFSDLPEELEQAAHDLGRLGVAAEAVGLPAGQLDAPDPRVMNVWKPSPGRDSMRTVPFCERMVSWTMSRPTPRPEISVVLSFRLKAGRNRNSSSSADDSEPATAG